LLDPTDEGLTLLDCHGKLIATINQPEARACSRIDLADMGPWLPRIAVALEDHRFYSHGGLDAVALSGAVYRDVRNARILGGASTITQQTIKLAIHRTHRDLGSKIYEIAAAWRLERLWSKDRILEEYLNRTSFGNRLIGPEAAAQAYFEKKAANLDLAESIYLAGLIQAPTRFNPWSHPASAYARYVRCLDQLVAAGVVDSRQREILQAHPPQALRHLPPRLAPHFVDFFLRQYPEAQGRITTTLDLNLQAAAEQMLREHVQELAHDDVTSGAIVIVDNHTGGILAMAGSPDFSGPQGQINCASIYRSCGSVLKPFLYLKALDQKILTAATLLPDTPDAIRAEYIDYDPKNYDNRFVGPVRMREALASSLNVPAVFTLSRVGPRAAFYYLQQWGLRFQRSFSDYGAGLILGNAEIRLVDLTTAFSGLARGGLFRGYTLRQDELAPLERLASQPAAKIITDILSDNNARRRTFGLLSPLAFDEKISAKTGTSSGFRDGWTVGSTSEHTVGVWMGNVDGHPMRELASAHSAAPLWHTLIDLLRAHGDTPSPSTDAEPDLVPAQICALTGLLPSPASPSTYREYFLKGTLPTRSASEMIRSVDHHPVLVLPAEYAAWCHSPSNVLGAVLEPNVSLRILQPGGGRTYVINRQLSPDQQMLNLEANSAPGETVSWQIDGKPVPSTHGFFLWPLETGHHTAQAQLGDQIAQASFTVL
jgi:penicillin-binding protein 1C